MKSNIKPLATGLLIAVAVSGLFTPYLNLWLGTISGIPAGSTIRDFSILLFGVVALYALFRGPVSPATMVLSMVWALYAGWILVLVVSHPHPFFAALVARTHILFPIFSAAALVLVISGRVNTETAARCLCVAGIVAALLGIVDALTQSAILKVLGFGLTNATYTSGSGETPVVGNVVGGIRRASGGLANPIDYGYVMAALALFGVLRGIPALGAGSRVADQPDRKISWLGIALLASAQLAVLLTLSRGPLLALALCALPILLYVLLKRELRRTTLKGLLALAAALLILDAAVIAGLAPEHGRVLLGRIDPAKAQVNSQGSANQTLSQEQLKGLSPKQRLALETGFSDALRAEQARDGFRALRREPLGLGLGTQGTGGSTKKQIVADIFFLWVPLEIGIPGLVLYVAATGTALFVGYRRLSTPATPRLGFALVFVFAGILSASFVSPVVIIPFWAAFALSGARRSQNVGK